MFDQSTYALVWPLHTWTLLYSINAPCSLVSRFQITQPDSETYIRVTIPKILIFMQIRYFCHCHVAAKLITTSWCVDWIELSNDELYTCTIITVIDNGDQNKQWADAVLPLNIANRANRMFKTNEMQDSSTNRFDDCPQGSYLAK